MRKSFLLLAMASILFFSAMAQKKNAKAPLVPSMESNADSILFSKLKYRLVGPFRGGRSGAVTGSYKNKMNFYFGTCLWPRTSVATS